MKKRPSSAGKPGPGGKPAAKKSGKSRGDDLQVNPVGLRIIGGKFRGRRLQYGGDLTVRPMKDRVREALFNLLGPFPAGTHALDLFAGTGALGLEALSRGAERVSFIERHWPTAGVLEQNLKALEVATQCSVTVSDTFFWWKHDRKFGPAPLIVFCSPPYILYHEQTADMLTIANDFLAQAPAGSQLIMESDVEFDTDQLPRASEWEVRDYRPARIAIFRLPLVVPPTVPAAPVSG